MPTTRATPDVMTRPETTERRPRSWPPLALALGCAAAYAVFFVLPYLANHLYRFPMHDVAIGYHDPKDLWPRNVPLVGLVFELGGLATLVCGPFVAVTTLVWNVVNLVRPQPPRDVRRVAALVLGAAVSLATIAYLLSPLGQALAGWWLD